MKQPHAANGDFAPNPVEGKRQSYLFAAWNAVHTMNASQRYRHALWLQVDAASIAYDNAVAAAHDARSRGENGSW